MAAIAAPATSPITDDAFASAMARIGVFESAPVLAVAVSGGPDSMALVWLADRWARARDGSAFAIIVDHGLRPESADEARIAAEQLRAAGIETCICKVSGTPPENGVPAWARKARYNLLRDAAVERGALHLLLAHHQDDQAETVLLRLARGSGVKGLSGMREVQPGADLRRLRPLLDVPKARVTATAEATGWTIADDPSNRAKKYARTRIRNALESLSGDTARLAKTAGTLASEDVAIEQAVTSLAVTAATIMPYGLIRLNRSRVAAAPVAVSARLLNRAVRMAGGADGPLRHSRIARLLQDITHSPDTRRTCGGAIIQIKGAEALLSREPAKLPDLAPLQSLKTGLWDNRFRLTPKDAASDQDGSVMIGPLGYAGLRELETMFGKNLDGMPPNALRGNPPRQVIAGLPVLRKNGRITGFSTFAPHKANDGPNPSICDISLFPVRFAPPTALTVANAC